MMPFCDVGSNWLLRSHLEGRCAIEGLWLTLPFVASKCEATVNDIRGNVRIVESLLDNRLTATMRHLTDPANLVYMLDMEGLFLIWTSRR
jgi:hypothetical protein